MLNTLDRYISTELTLCDTEKTFPKNEVFVVDDIYEGLEQLPSAEPRKKGKWIDNRDVSWMCSECGKWLDVLQGDVDMNYCPNCGAKMEVKK